MKTSLVTLIALVASITLSTHSSFASKEATEKVQKNQSAHHQKAKTKSSKKKQPSSAQNSLSPRVSAAEVLKFLVLNSNDIRVIAQKGDGTGMELYPYSLAQLLDMLQQSGNLVRFDKFRCIDLTSETATICHLKVEEISMPEGQGESSNISMLVTKENGKIKMHQVLDQLSANGEKSTEPVPEQSVLFL